MTDITQAIAELREATEKGDWKGVWKWVWAVDKAIRNQSGLHEQLDALHTVRVKLDMAPSSPATPDVFSALDALESAVEGGTVEPIGYALRCDIDIENDIWECVLSNREDAEVRREELQRTTGFKFDILSLYTSPTPDLTSRIEAAAEEIEGVIEKVIKNGFNQYEKQSGIFIPITIKWDRGKFTAIITRHLQGGK